jgi:hypothetical protein
MPQAVHRTTEDLYSHTVRQFSVFLENKVGALLDLTRTLGEGNVHICGLSVIDTSDSAVIRMVVDDPEHCRQILSKANIPFSESAIVAVELPHGPERLNTVLRTLVAAEINIQYTYSLMIRPRGNAVLALHSDDVEYSVDVLRKAGFTVLGQKDISR